jgi:hypothetical protein
VGSPQAWSRVTLQAGNHDDRDERPPQRPQNLPLAVPARTRPRAG